MVVKKSKAALREKVNALSGSLANLKKFFILPSSLKSTPPHPSLHMGLSDLTVDAF